VELPALQGGRRLDGAARLLALRSLPQRDVGHGWSYFSGQPAAAGAMMSGPRPPVPDSEVIARPRRRRFTAEYKRSIIDQADAAQDVWTVGLLLRREGLYSSHLATWRRQRKQGVIDALTPKKVGPKVVISPLVKENRELLAANARLTKKLKNAELIIEVPKKVAVLLGNPIPNIQIDEEN
jgi:transposase-like protein